MARPPAIDRDKLRAALRKIGREYVFYMLDEVIDLVPPAKLEKVVAKYLDVKRLRPDDGKAKASLLAEVKAFGLVIRICGRAGARVSLQGHDRERLPRPGRCETHRLVS